MTNDVVRTTSPGFEAFTVFAPGRVNLIGEHTDYNDGFVLPLAITKGVRLAVRRRDDGRIVLRSDRETAVVEISAAVVPQPGRRDWARYPLGVVAGCHRLGWTIPSFEARVSADLPAGGGLSSSAALEVATATALETLCGRRLDPVAKAVLCQRAEHEFAGVPCGIMDQLAVAGGLAGHALLIDCRSLEIRPVPLDARAVAVAVIDSGVSRRLADGRYAERRAECAAAARRLGRPALRDVTAADWAAGVDVVPAVERRRAAHVLAENRRTLDAAAALDRGDWPAVGRLMRESHASLAADFEVSCPELDTLCGVAAGIPGVYGCRMTGAGFGGSAVALVEAERAAEILEEIRRRYREATGIDAAAFVTAAAAGAHVEEA